MHFASGVERTDTKSGLKGMRRVLTVHQLKLRHHIEQLLKIKECILCGGFFGAFVHFF